jgi:hypothetical protein
LRPGRLESRLAAEISLPHKQTEPLPNYPNSAATAAKVSAVQFWHATSGLATVFESGRNWD